ncbi:hypothetical protein IIV31_099R [Armadillidium vulgare iridescent virus]|uniref:Uncharacterized protein n=1 Tax=Armadillidium vulgare iridescent virus TaxID=72201 RepID=A0A068QKH9_9VIRU|nr:hypothetical protein IIV31_099R [Armadillidium vulgare iridescent virus]CCV02471.1 hypothetical protein IIV31_099R [Armadillidium vulgare iridescent virus]
MAFIEINSKRFRQTKVEDISFDVCDDEGDMDFDEGFGAEEAISFHDEIEDDLKFGEYNELDPAPTWFEAMQKHRAQKNIFMQPANNRVLRPVQILPSPSPYSSQPKTESKWAFFSEEKEQKTGMVVIGRIKKRKPTPIVEKIGSAKKRNFSYGKKPAKQTAKELYGRNMTLSKNHFCVSITKGVECPHYSCTYIHHFSQLEDCPFKEGCKFVSKIETGPPCSVYKSTEHDRQIYVAAEGCVEEGVVVHKCLKKHPGECVESYLLRLQIKIFDKTQLVLNIQEPALKDNLKNLLESSKACGLEKLVIKIYKPEPEKEEEDPSDDDGDEEWYSSPRRK